MNAKDENGIDSGSEQQASAGKIDHGASVFAIPTRGGVPLPAYDVIWPERRILVAIGVATPGPTGLLLDAATKAMLPQLDGITESPDFTVAYCSSHANFVAILDELRGKAENGAQYLMLLPDFDVASGVVLQLGVQRPPSVAIH